MGREPAAGRRRPFRNRCSSWTAKTEIELLEELAGLREARSFFLDDAVTTSPVSRYTCPDRFAQERQALFRSKPVIAAHGSELAEPDPFLTRDLAGLPLLLTRDSAGIVHAFLNVCRHRGTRLVGDDSGCRRRFTCPYHAWTYDNRGALKGIAHGEAGFPGIDKAALGLKRLGCAEAYGWIWVAADSRCRAGYRRISRAVWAGDFAWFGADGLKIVHEEAWERAANWKILFEGGPRILPFPHRPQGHDRPVFPGQPVELPGFRPSHPLHPAARRARRHDRPAEGKLVAAAGNQSGLFLSSRPRNFWSRKTISSGFRASRWRRTGPWVRLATLVPADLDPADAAAAQHWRKNHDITVRTLAEDFAIGESIQSGLLSGANDELRFGRFEGALDRFNRIVERDLAAK